MQLHLASPLSEGFLLPVRLLFFIDPVSHDRILARLNQSPLSFQRTNYLDF